MYTMTKKRKVRDRRQINNLSQEVWNGGPGYAANETFDESEDEFFASQDKILLEEGPEAKRRKRVSENSR